MKIISDSSTSTAPDDESLDDLDSTPTLGYQDFVDHRRCHQSDFAVAVTEPSASELLLLQQQQEKEEKKEKLALTCWKTILVLVSYTFRVCLCS